MIHVVVWIPMKITSGRYGRLGSSERSGYFIDTCDPGSYNDLVPLRAAWQHVAYGDDEGDRRWELSELDLEGPGTVAIGSPGISRDPEADRMGVASLAHAFSPPSDATAKAGVSWS